MSAAGEPGMKIISYGGGVQSTALVVLAARGALDGEMGGPVTHALFANVGDDSESPETLPFVREVVAPWAAEHGIEVVEVHRTWRDGRGHTLLQHITKPEQKVAVIPMRGDNGAPLGRSCTADHKVAAIATWLRANGATKDRPADVALGISTDEIQRVKTSYDKGNPLQRRRYPLIGLGLNRGDCQRINRETFGIDAPRSACWFCPFHSTEEWRRLRLTRPDLFDRAVELEAALSAREQAGKSGGRLWITGAGAKSKRTLREVMDANMDQGALFGEDGCDEGYCWT